MNILLGRKKKIIERFIVMGVYMLYVNISKKLSKQNPRVVKKKKKRKVRYKFILGYDFCEFSAK